MLARSAHWTVCVTSWVSCPVVTFPVKLRFYFGNNGRCNILLSRLVVMVPYCMNPITVLLIWVLWVLWCFIKFIVLVSLPSLNIGVAQMFWASLITDYVILALTTWMPQRSNRSGDKGDLECTGHLLQLAIKSGLVLPDGGDAAQRVVSHFCHSAEATCTLKRRHKCQSRMTAVQHVFSDEAVTKPSVQKSLTMRAPHWQLLEHY